MKSISDKENYMVMFIHTRAESKFRLALHIFINLYCPCPGIEQKKGRNRFPGQCMSASASLCLAATIGVSQLSWFVFCRLHLQDQLKKPFRRMRSDNRRNTLPPRANGTRAEASDRSFLHLLWTRPPFNGARVWIFLVHD